MTIPAMSDAATETLVGMGQIASGRAPARMKAVLGSCIALAIYHPRLKAGCMAHIVLPESAGRGGAPGKFADTAVPEMVRVLAALGAPAHGLAAKFSGGGNMFGSTGPMQIGDANAAAVLAALEGAGIRAAGRDVGGTQGRRVVFDCESGEMIVECAGRPTRVL
jgi:chemotaxis protein CheD